jgi:hypothetical protein
MNAKHALRVYFGSCYTGLLFYSDTDTVDDIIKQLPTEVREGLTPRAVLITRGNVATGPSIRAQGQTQMGSLQQLRDVAVGVVDLYADLQEIEDREKAHEAKVLKLLNFTAPPLSQPNNNIVIEEELVNMLNTKLPKLNDDNLQNLAAKLAPEAAEALKKLSTKFENLPQSKYQNT